MGKAARERARRKAEATTLVVVEDPKPRRIPTPPATQSFEETTTTKQPWACRVVGCSSLALERHEGPNGAVWLCGSCGRIARANLAAEAAKQAFADSVVALYKPTLERYERRRRGIYGKSKGVERAKTGDLLEAAGAAPPA